MKVEICGNIQIVPDGTDVSGKPWCKVVEEPKKVKNGSKIKIDGHVYTIVCFRLIPQYKQWYILFVDNGDRYNEAFPIDEKDAYDFFQKGIELRKLSDMDLKEETIEFIS